MDRWFRTVTVVGLLGLMTAVGSAIAAESKEVKVWNMKKDTFDDEVDKGPHFVMFFAPWCPHCKKIDPVWEDLAAKYNEPAADSGPKEVTIGKVDCTVETELCSDQDVTGYPTLKYFKSGKDSGTKYRGKRDLNTLSDFVDEQLGKVVAKAEEAVSEPGEAAVEEGLHVLTESSFQKHVSSGDHFIKFFAPWCGHCKKMAPAWKDLAKQVHEDSNMKVKVAEVDCTKFQEVCKENQVGGYPTLMYFRDGKKLETYEGSRNLKDLVDYVKYWNGEKAGQDGGDKKVVQEGTAEPSSSSSPLALDVSNFKEHTRSGFAFVKFFAPWCGHCKKLAPTWDQLAKAFEDQPDKVLIAKVDCTADGDKNRVLCNDNKVKGFPTLIMFKDGERVDEYKGDRTLDDLKSFVQKMTSSAEDKSTADSSSKDEL